MKKIRLEGSTPCEILIGKNLIQCSGEYINEVSAARQALIITDTVVNELYSSVLASSIMKKGIEVFLFVLDNGETSKCVQTVEKLYSFLIKNEFTRSDVIIALGGGVVGDVSGFVAATYMRGMDLVQIPTTLLSQIDSAIGGKNGVNLPHGKNLVGTTYQPKLVLNDLSALATMSPKLFSDGMAEAIKYGLIRSKELFYKIKNSNVKESLEDFIFECVSVKKDIIEADEHEKNERKLLNFGHSLGHAIERLYNFSGYTHGHAVAIGMAYAARAGERLGITQSGTYDEIIEVLKQYNLPFTIDCEINDLMALAQRDKKSLGAYFDVVMIESIGKGFVKRIPTSELKKYIGG